MGISVCDQLTELLPSKKEPLPRWVLVDPNEGRGKGYLTLDVVDGLNEDEAIFLFTSLRAVQRFTDSNNGTLELHLFTPRKYGLEELFDLMERFRLSGTPPVMYGVVDVENIHPCQGLRSFLLSAALVEIDAALTDGTEDVFIETDFVVNY